jgi:GDPmannose 4,6-dehydratase
LKKRGSILIKQKKIALITGVTGQDGAYLTELLLKKGYLVIGIYRRSSTDNFWRLKDLGLIDHKDLKLVEGDITDLSSLISIINNYKPQEIYNLAAQSHVHTSFKQPLLTADITGVGPLNILEAIKLVDQNIKFYQASTSEMFGEVQSVPQNENTSFYPRSPYGVAKLYAHWISINYRESYNIFACNGILFNHESPLRGLEFVTRKITNGVARIKKGSLDHIELGNLDAKRDWGHARDYVEGMWLMLQADKPDDYILATNRTETVRTFLSLSFKAVNIDISFEGEGVNEVGFNKANGKVIVKVNPDFYRPAEVDLLQGNADKANKILGWKPKISLEDLCKMMVDADLVRN